MRTTNDTNKHEKSMFQKPQITQITQILTTKDAKIHENNNLETTDYTEYTDFHSQIASPQEPTKSEEFWCV